MTVGLVIVSHSARLAEGVVEVASEMAHGAARIIAAGGAEAGGLGTSLERVAHAIEEAESGDGVLVLADLGSAILTAEMASEQVPVQQRGRVVIGNAPLVEGAIVAAIESSINGTLADVVRAAESAASMQKVAKRSNT